MAFPLAPTNGQQHAEGNKNYIYDLPNTAWLVEDISGSGTTDLGNVPGATSVTISSSTGLNTNVPASTTTTAGVMSAVDKVKLNGVETAATADQVAAEVPITAIAGITATDVQAALAEHQGDLDALTALGGDYTGSAATFLGLPSTRLGGAALIAGDTAILNVDDGGNQSGWYAWNGTAWALAKEIPETLTVNSATDAAEGLVELTTTAEAAAGTDTTRAVTAAGLAVAVPALETDTTFTNVGSLVTYTGEDASAVVRDLRIPAGTALPTDGTNERLYVITGGALPVGLYGHDGVNWFQV